MNPDKTIKSNASGRKAAAARDKAHAATRPIVMTTHTPGPWMTGSGDCHGVYGPKQNGHQQLVARCPDHHKSHEYDSQNMAANARLIAAAPEMLEALRLVARAIEANPQLRDVLLYSEGTHGDRLYPFDAVPAAIAKATGGAL